jgi:hypothetical protein
LLTYALAMIAAKPFCGEKTLTTLVREGAIASTALGKNAAAHRRRRTAAN